MMLSPTITEADLIEAGIRLKHRQATTTLPQPWAALARPSQLPPDGSWRFWLLMMGRGAGKTRTGAEYVVAEIQAGRAREAMLIAATASDVRDVVVEGPAGIVKVCERLGWRVRYESSKMKLTFPNGAIARTRSAEEPDRIRGPEADLAWWDEYGTWSAMDALTNADFGLRKLGPQGHRARAVVTFTPKPTKLVKALIARPDAVLTRGRTSDNAANLDPATLAAFEVTYGSTRLARQELEGELLEDVEGALWTLSTIDTHRLAAVPAGIDLSRVVVGVDPPATATGAECGIVVVARGSDGRGYVLDDRSRRGSPNEWANAVVACYDQWQADAVVIEVNQGGDMATNTLKTVRRTLPIKPVHAARGKALRAQPVAALYEQGRCAHIGSFPVLEDQMCSWVPGDDSPDRLDALAWAMTETVVDRPRKLRVF